MSDLQSITPPSLSPRGIHVYYNRLAAFKCLKLQGASSLLTFHKHFQTLLDFKKVEWKETSFLVIYAMD